MLVRLAQQFASIDFTPEVAPASVPPPGYADSPGSDGTDRVWMGSHLTMYAKVCVHSFGLIVRLGGADAGSQCS